MRGDDLAAIFNTDLGGRLRGAESSYGKNEDILDQLWLCQPADIGEGDEVPSLLGQILEDSSRENLEE